MADYGVLPTGFSRKPLDLILSEMENKMMTQFGVDLIQTSVTPMGMINGLQSEMVAIAYELFEAVYQSYDPDQAEGSRLDMLGRLRLVDRAQGESDESYRIAITNAGQARIDIQDLTRAIKAIDGVTYVQIFLPENGQIDEFTIPSGTMVVAVTGGDDTEIALAMRKFIVPGINSWGNVEITSVIDGFCRTAWILRPLMVDVQITVNVIRRKDKTGCPPPSSAAIRDAIVNGLFLLNGDDVTEYRVRSVVENAFPGTVEVESIIGTRDELPDTSVVGIGFTERASIAIENVIISITDE